MGLAGQSEEAASCANWSWGWRAKVEIDQEVEVHSKVLVVASKCVSGNDFWLSFILSEQIFPSNKTILKMNKSTSPNGRREEARSSGNERPGDEQSIKAAGKRVVFFPRRAGARRGGGPGGK